VSWREAWAAERLDVVPFGGQFIDCGHPPTTSGEPRRSVWLTVAAVDERGPRRARVWWARVAPVVVGRWDCRRQPGSHLLVRPSYATRRWTLPGRWRQTRRDACSEGAADTEIREEAGVTATSPGEVSLLGVYANFKQGKSASRGRVLIRDWEQSRAAISRFAKTRLLQPERASRADVGRRPPPHRRVPRRRE